MLTKHVVFDKDAVQDVTFDFTDDLAVGETLTGASVVITATIEGDTVAALILEGVHTLVGSVVTQKIKSVLPDTIYSVKCKVDTSEGNTLIRKVRIIGRES